MIPSFPKIFALGSHYISQIFDGPVEVTEKVDGSQFAFGNVNGELMVRSKGRMIFPEALKANDMFAPIVDYVQGISAYLPENLVFYGEYLRKPKHNTLAYERTPKNMLCLFGVMQADGKFLASRDELVYHAQHLDVDPVPVMQIGEIDSASEVAAFLETESYLGGAKVEGVVVKNYGKPFLLGGQPIPLMAGKYVSEAFKEVHRKGWDKEHTSKGRWQDFIERHRSEARWQKAVQHLAEAGKLENEPRDIGKLIAEVKRDITEEEREAITAFLWREFSPELLRRSTAGLPEWYKARLLESSFEAAQ